MNYDLLLALVFYIILYGIFFKYKHKFVTQGRFLVMYKTRLGLKSMNNIARKFSWLLDKVGYASVSIGFVAMIGIFILLIKGAIDVFTKPEAVAAVTPLIPGVEVAPGLPVLSFWHWIIAILIIAALHEFSHGIYARLNNVPIKSSGFAFLGPILAAFVEPNEKVMQKKTRRKQLAIFAAGPFGNIVTGFVFLAIVMFIIAPISASGLHFGGAMIYAMNNSCPINNSGLKVGDVITGIDGVALQNSSSMGEILAMHKAGDKINISTLNNSYITELGSDGNSTKARLGVFVSSYYGKIGFGTRVGFWLIELFFWLYLISLGVGLFNLLPLGPVDGGRMFYVAMIGLFGNKERARKVWKFVSSFCLFLILLNLLPFIMSVIRFISSLF